MNDQHALKTYRYLRLAMIGLVVMLAASVVIEILRADGCLRTSISAYYFSPVRAVFVGALVAIGACLIVLKGNTDAEDILLNIAGLLAPVVAFVPISDPHECRASLLPGADAGAAIGNNIGAYLVTGVLGLIVTWWLARSADPGRSLSRAEIIGLMGTLVCLVSFCATFWWARPTFTEYAHYAAAIPLFVCFIVVVLLNARGYGDKQAVRQCRTPVAKDRANRYFYLAMLMGALVLIEGAFKLAGFEHALFWLEATVIVLFAAFWVLQTIELWDEGVRDPP